MVIFLLMEFSSKLTRKQIIYRNPLRNLRRFLVRAANITPGIQRFPKSEKQRLLGLDTRIRFRSQIFSNILIRDPS